MWIVVCMGSLAGWRNSRYRRAAEVEQGRLGGVLGELPPVGQQADHGRRLRPPRSWVAGAGWTSAGRVSSRASAVDAEPHGDAADAERDLGQQGRIEVHSQVQSPPESGRQNRT